MWSHISQGGVLDRPISLGSLAVESVVLMKSELKPTGSVYTKLWEVRTRETRLSPVLVQRAVSEEGREPPTILLARARTEGDGA